MWLNLYGTLGSRLKVFQKNSSWLFFFRVGSYEKEKGLEFCDFFDKVWKKKNGSVGTKPISRNRDLQLAISVANE
jgi:hypothetical protein